METTTQAKAVKTTVDATKNTTTIHTGKAGRPSVVPTPLANLVISQGAGTIKGLAAKLQCSRAEAVALLDMFASGKADTSKVAKVLETKGELIAAFAVMLSGQAPQPVAVNP